LRQPSAGNRAGVAKWAHPSQYADSRAPPSSAASNWKENRSRDRTCFESSVGRLQERGLGFESSSFRSWKLNRARREPGCYPVRAPSPAWCASHPASARWASSLSRQWVGGRYWLAAPGCKPEPFTALRVQFPPDPRITRIDTFYFVTTITIPIDHHLPCTLRVIGHSPPASHAPPSL
jgi:hypothetical protein